jgi:phosphatidylethanolamine/phosphatidyl-N-methylethanolamine N-methyltransferase
MARQISEYVTFLREVKRTFYTTGAVLPSGKQLTVATIQPYLRHDRPARILEAGPGTGAVTQQLVPHLRPGDVLDIVELNDQFVDVLKRRFQTEPAFQRAAHQSTIHHLPIQQYHPEQPYDFILCGLPFNNFPTELVKDIFRHFMTMLAPGGVLSFFEYLWIRRMKAMFVSRPERQRLARVGCVLEWYIERYRFQHTKALVNFPPAVVHHLRLAEDRHRTDDIVAA